MHTLRAHIGFIFFQFFLLPAKSGNVVCGPRSAVGYKVSGVGEGGDAWGERGWVESTLHVDALCREPSLREYFLERRVTEMQSGRSRESTAYREDFPALSAACPPDSGRAGRYVNKQVLR